MSESENTQLVVLDDSTLPIFFDPDAREKAMAMIEAAEKHVMSEVCDASTEEGRKREMSLSRQISSMKVAIDDYGAEQIKGLKQKVKAFDAIRKELRDRLDGIRDKRLEGRKKWEEEEAKRQERIRNAMDRLNNLGEPVGAQNPLPQRKQILEHRIQAIDEAMHPEEFWDEYYGAAEASYQKGKDSIKAQLEEVNQLIEQAEKIAKLEAEAEARRKADEEERLRKEGEERAKREFEAEQERKRQAEEQAHEAAEQSMLTPPPGYETPPEARAQPPRTLGEAIYDHGKQQVKQQQATEAPTGINKGKVHSEIVSALMTLKNAQGFPIFDWDDQAKNIVIAIVRGQIPHVNIQY